MSLRVSFELSDRDLKHFRRLMAEVRAKIGETDEPSIVAAARGLLGQLSQAEAPEFVRERTAKLEILIQMLGDAEWKLSPADRARIVRALAYFAEAEDLIPDRIPVLGFIDDAIMIELVAREMKHEFEAFQDFCAYRNSQEKIRGKKEDAVTREAWLKARRRQLHSRMRRRRQRQTGGSSERRRFSLW